MPPLLNRKMIYEIGVAGPLLCHKLYTIKDVIIFLNMVSTFILVLGLGHMGCRAGGLGVFPPQGFGLNIGNIGFMPIFVWMLRIWPSD